MFLQTQSRSQTKLTNIFPILLTATPPAGSAGASGEITLRALLTVGGQPSSVHPAPQYFQCWAIFSRTLAYCCMRNRAGQETRYQLHSTIWVWEFFPSGVRNQLYVTELKFSFNIEICHFQNELRSLRCLHIFLEDGSEWKPWSLQPRPDKIFTGSSTAKPRWSSFSVILLSVLSAEKGSIHFQTCCSHLAFKDFKTQCVRPMSHWQCIRLKRS